MAPDVAQGNQIVQAGYGLQAKYVSKYTIGINTHTGNAYEVIPRSMGTLLVGANTATDLKAGFSYYNREVGIKYTYNSLQGTFAFSTNAAGVVTSGTTYLLPGNSGGPTFESNGMGGLALVGLHSTSQRSIVNGTVIPYNFPGQFWEDVNVSQYNRRRRESRKCLSGALDLGDDVDRLGWPRLCRLSQGEKRGA